MVLERGEVANSWRHERWDSLRLLTPNWQSRLPGHRYEGEDPDGYMTMREVIDRPCGEEPARGEAGMAGPDHDCGDAFDREPSLSLGPRA